MQIVWYFNIGIDLLDSPAETIEAFIDLHAFDEAIGVNSDIG